MPTANDLFFADGLNRHTVQRNLDAALKNADDGEFFFEYSHNEALMMSDGHIKSMNTSLSRGYGLRAVSGENVGYAHGDVFEDGAFGRSAAVLDTVTKGQSGTLANPPLAANHQLYLESNPIDLMPLTTRVAVLEAIDSYVRKQDPRIIQCSVKLAAQWQLIEMMFADNRSMVDIRPLVRVDISVIAKQGDRQEVGHCGRGGRTTFDEFITTEGWRSQADVAIKQALLNLDSRPAPAGEMTVVLGPGWPGVLLHEAVGHGLEGDFNRKGTSTFAGRVGERVAAKGVTVIDDGTLANRRGSLNIDDEGTPTQHNVLIEDGILKGYLQDRQNARLSGTAPTGNGRRESYAHTPMPRMTNTFMAAGAEDPEGIIASVSSGIYATQFGGGQVDITNGKFVFSCTEAYAIENGKIGAPLKGATLIGNGPDVMGKISMIGNDLELDEGIGTCGKDGQGVPVGVGQPTLRIDGITVGGTGG
ncbi:MAG: metalloprotease TldD [Alphaproteobacteria bacterium]|nr:metalloprotease TldD [Alphaproteobacteria bacterium]